MAQDSYSTLKTKIEKEIARLQKQAKALQTKQRRPVITSIVRSMREYDITPEEIEAAYNRRPRSSTASGSGATGRTVPPKYRNPETGDTWTGRGKAPRWLTQAEAEGRTRDDFLIQK